MSLLCIMHYECVYIVFYHRHYPPLIWVNDSLCTTLHVLVLIELRLCWHLFALPSFHVSVSLLCVKLSKHECISHVSCPPSSLVHSCHWSSIMSCNQQQPCWPYFITLLAWLCGRFYCSAELLSMSLWQTLIRWRACRAAMDVTFF